MQNGCLRLPRAVYSGENTISKVFEILKSENVKRVAVFTDKVIKDRGLLEYPLAEIRKSGVSYLILDDLSPEPTYQQAQQLIDQCKAYHADLIMAVGGGSVMDTAKLASILMTDNYGIKDLLDDPTKGKKSVRTLLIPTTAGTGSEATPNAIVAVPEKELKIGIVNTDMIADYAILDAVMIKDLPRKIAAATGVDALAHAIECWTSNKANPLSDTFAFKALEMILSNIEQACDDPEAMEAKQNMQLASFYAGAAIASSGTTAVHALSYPLGGKYHIAHGISNAILLVPVMRFNEPACRERLAAVYDGCIKGNATSAQEKSGAVIERLEQIIQHLGIPENLREFHVSKDDLDDLVVSGMQVTRLLANNMRTITADDARRIYERVL